MSIKDLALHALWALFILLFGFLLTTLSDSMKSLSNELHEFKYTVSANYVRREDLLRIENKIDKLHDLIHDQFKRGQL